MDEKYFAELSRILSRHGIESGPVANGRLIQFNLLRSLLRKRQNLLMPFWRR